MKKVCCIYNYAMHYRHDIFVKMNKELGCYFVFGDKFFAKDGLKQMDFSQIEGSYTIVENHIFLRWPFYWQKGVISFLKKDFDAYIILGDPFCVSTWLFLLRAKLSPKKKIYFWTHGWYGRESFIKRIVKKVFFHLGELVFTYGDYARDLMIKEGFKPEKVLPIHNSLSYDKQLEIRKNLKATSIYKDHFKNDDKTLIFIGRLTPIKKLHKIIRAMAKLAEKGVNLNLAIIGDGTQMGSLTALAQNLKLAERVWFYGPSYNEEELSSLIYNADVCVSPGDVGLTAMHAMVYGCPVISHNDFKNQMPEFEAIREGETGSFFVADNIDSLADTIKNWLEKSSDREVVRQKCYAEIDQSWNPYYQMDILKKGLGIE